MTMGEGPPGSPITRRPQTTASCAGIEGQLPVQEEPTGKPKPFAISKQIVWEAYRRVKVNKGGAGVDGESIAEFEGDLEGNLYKLWNRSGAPKPLFQRVKVPPAPSPSAAP